MGVDIQGWDEIEESFEGERGTSWEWFGIVKIDRLVHRSYGMFGVLFGWRNGYRFTPLVGERGIPEDMSDELRVTRDEYGGSIHPTWVLWSEVATVDWNEEGVDSYDEATDTLYGEPGPGRRLIRKSDYLNGGWVLLLEFMERLAQQYGPEHVRLSVFFDSLS